MDPVVAFAAALSHHGPKSCCPPTVTSHGVAHQPALDQNRTDHSSPAGCPAGRWHPRSGTLCASWSRLGCRPPFGSGSPGAELAAAYRPLLIMSFLQRMVRVDPRRCNRKMTGPALRSGSTSSTRCKCTSRRRTEAGNPSPSPSSTRTYSSEGGRQGRPKEIGPRGVGPRRGPTLHHKDDQGSERGARSLGGLDRIGDDQSAVKSLAHRARLSTHRQYPHGQRLRSSQLALG